MPAGTTPGGILLVRLINLGELRAFQCQVVHQSLLAEDKADNRITQFCRVDRAAGTQGHHGNIGNRTSIRRIMPDGEPL